MVLCWVCWGILDCDLEVFIVVCTLLCFPAAAGSFGRSVGLGGALWLLALVAWAMCVDCGGILVCLGVGFVGCFCGALALRLRLFCCVYFAGLCVGFGSAGLRVGSGGFICWASGEGFGWL